MTLGNQFADELQILGQKVISIRPTWKKEANETLKTQYAYRLHDPYILFMRTDVWLPRRKSAYVFINFSLLLHLFY